MMDAKKTGPVDCKSKLESIVTRASESVKDLLISHQARLNKEYDSIRASHFP